MNQSLFQLSMATDCQTCLGSLEHISLNIKNKNTKSVRLNESKGSHITKKCFLMKQCKLKKKNQNVKNQALILTSLTVKSSSLSKVGRKNSIFSIKIHKTIQTLIVIMKLTHLIHLIPLAGICQVNLSSRLQVKTNLRKNLFSLLLLGNLMLESQHLLINYCKKVELLLMIQLGLLEMLSVYNGFMLGVELHQLILLELRLEVNKAMTQLTC